MSTSSATAQAGKKVDRAQEETEHGATAPPTRQRLVSLTATNYIAQYAGGAALNDTTGPWTEFNPTRLPQIVLGAGGANPTVYTITGTGLDGRSITDTVTAAGAGTYTASEPFQTITAFSSDVDPVGTTDLQAGDTWVAPPARTCHVGTAGNIACRLAEDDADVTVPSVPAGEFTRQIKIIRITSTTAAGLVLGW
jgi:hypothetical protein